jgi:4-phospho-D-threonate 3-dehydrogenase / 4-phospho-D-erythronate 3-dehydrogenase
MTTTDTRPLVGVTMGDPAGIGPEIVVKALANPAIYEQVRPLVIGDRRSLERACTCVACPFTIHTVDNPDEGGYQPGTLDLIDMDTVPDNLEMGQVQAAAGLAAFYAIKHSIALASRGQLEAVATAPINKEALRAASIPYIGHTEMYADLTGSPDTLTMFEVLGVRILFLSRHVPLRQACDLVTRDRIIDTVHKAIHNLQRLGIALPHIAVAGLNPHAGDGGLHGNEEIDEVIPAVEALKAEGIPITGPIAADSVFHMARKGAFGMVLSLYHDQGHIAAKCIDFERTISVTLGLPFLRTSVDHGTAFDIAGTGQASEVSMVEAILATARLLRGA